MKIFSFAKKELGLIASQKKSLLLIILYPLMIILIIVFAFGGSDMQVQSGFERADVAYYVPPGSENFDSQDFLDQLGNIERLQIHRVGSPEHIKEAINLGIAKVGIVVEEPASKFEPVNAKFYYDNSSPLVSKIVMSYTHFAVSLFASEKSTKILTGIWSNLDTIKGRLGEQYAKIESFEDGLDAARERIVSFEEKIDDIEIEFIKEKLDEFDTHYYDSKNQIANAKADLVDAQSKLSDYRAKLIGTRNELSTYSSDLKSIKGDIASLKVVSPQPLYGQLAEIELELGTAITRIDSAISDIDNAITDIDQSQQKLAQTTSDLDDAGTKLDSARETVGEFKLVISDLESTIDELKVLIAESYDYHLQTKSNLAETKLLLDDLTQMLEEFMNYEPSYLVHPFRVEETRMYLVDEEYRAIEKTTILIPVSITILLLLTCVLFASISTIIERKQGINFRVSVSPTGKFSWLSGKILGQVIFAMLEAGIILLLAFFVFGVPLIGSAIDLLIALFFIALCFVTIGVFLTNFTNKQSTAILSSLVIMLPLLFLSGLVFPIEFMPFYVQGIAYSLPLTAGTGLLMNVIVKGIPILHSLDKIALLFIPTAVLFIISLLKKRI